MTTKIRRRCFKIFLILIGVSLVACSCGQINKNMNSLAEEAAEQFNIIVQGVTTPEEAKDAIEFYKTLEMNFIKVHTKYGMNEPLRRFYSQTSNSLSILNRDFKIVPEYDSIQKRIKRLAQ